MTPGARLQAAIELLAAIHGGTAPADRAAAAFFRSRRYIGGGDRRAVIDRVYAVLRRRAALDWWIGRAMPETAFPDPERARTIAALTLLEGWSADRVGDAFDGGRFRPAPLDSAERQLAHALAGNGIDSPDQPSWVRLEFPEWLTPQLAEAFGPRLETEMTALMVEAPLDLRANALKASRESALAALAQDGVTTVPTLLSPVGLRVEEGRPPLATLDSFKQGLIEVQDEGSQLASLLVDARPGMRVVDFCAGAGGKTLALAAAMRNKGQVVACDVLRGRVDRAAVRLRRAGAHNVERRGLSSERDPWVKRHAASFDRVLVDAPCSGAGTWRRNPDAKWRLRPEDLTELQALQRRIIESACRLVRPGGRLVYVTCSLLPAENEEQIDWFTAQRPDFALRSIADVWAEVIGGACPAGGPTLALTPARNGTDGFFVAVLERAPAVEASP
ncbi:RsmB/NOP family class I SAM-dependent RNA methyltransferase [Rhodospirillaceae bacterium SYSU D60014]|uniref:RsmB/NOP family class I SAM-dependent RNA methyltransferase n=1 Tax=Virgifigura deserti TaxID=2268457 RepID=UPI000E66AF1E